MPSDFKQLVTDDDGESSVKCSTPRCNGCGEEIVGGQCKKLQCSKCKAVRYCGKKCQEGHWKQHKVLCSAIKYLEDAGEVSCTRRCTFEPRKIARLIGGRCTIDCLIGGIGVEGLWDTGSQVALISKQWLEDNLSRSEVVKSVTELIGRNLEVEGVGGNNIPYEGYVELPFKVKGNRELLVPFLVTKEDISHPIIGYNVISELIANEDDKTAKGMLTTLLNDDVDSEKIPLLLNELRETTREEEVVSTVTIKKDRSGIKLKPGQSMKITCKVNRIIVEERTPVYFEPEIPEALPNGLHVEHELLYLKKGANSKIAVTVSNTSVEDIAVPSQISIGELYQVASVTPTDVALSKSNDDVSGATAGAHRQDSKVSSTQTANVKEDVTLSKNSATKLSSKGNEGDSGATAGVHRQDSKVSSTRTTYLKGKEVKSKDSSSAKVNQKQSGSRAEDKEWRKRLEKFDLSNLTSKQKEEVRELLWEERESFAMSSDDVGCAPELVMALDTVDDVPVQRNYNSIPRPLISKVKQHVEDLLNRQWITKSKSAWSSPVVIVRKKCGDIRLCCDFRALNAKTVPDSHPLPRVQDTLDSLQGSKWFSVLDQTRAYYQGFVADKDREKTAFVTPWGLYEWNRIPFGLRNAPSCFQRYMEGTVEEFRDEFALPYLDDVIVYSGTFEDHIKHLRIVLQRTRMRGLKLNLDKCDLFRREVKFLGRVVNEEGYRMDADKIKAVTELKNFVPSTVTDVRHLMGLLGFHRRHVQDFSRRAKPITNLLLVDKDEINDVKARKKKKVNWSAECQEALSSLIDDIISAPILVYPNFEEEFIVHTDASLLGLGAILYQKRDGKMCVVAYASRTLNKAEENYHPTKLEFLALRWAVSDAFREYLGYANHFWVFTDNNPLVYMMSSSKLNAFGERWLSELAEYNFTTKYRPGVVNKDADCMSRLPLDIEGYMRDCTEEIPADAFRAIMSGVQTKQVMGETWRMMVNAVSADVVKDSDREPDMTLLNNKSNIKSEQSRDQNISVIVKAIKDKVPVKIEPNDPKELKILKRSINQIKFSDEGLVVRESRGIEQVVLPKSMSHLI